MFIFEVSRSNDGIPIFFDAGTGDRWCGTVTPGTGGTPGPVRILRDSNCGSSRRARRLNVVVHELAHVAGWNTQHGPPIAGTAASVTAGHCTTFLPRESPLVEENPVPGTVCHHDVEPIFRARLDGGWAPEEALFQAPLLVDAVTVPAAITGLVAGTTTPLTVTHWQSSPDGGLVPQDNASVVWSSRHPTVAAVDAPGTIRGVAAGSALLRLQASPAAVPTGYALWRPFRDLGDSVAVTVVAGATRIELDQVPVTTLGMHTLTFHGPGTPGPLVWTIDDSRTTRIIPDTTYETNGWQLSVFIGPGSYRLRVSAGGIIHDFPVCTGLNVVAGCLPPEEE
jgi:hypothetical protein